MSKNCKITISRWQGNKNSEKGIEITITDERYDTIFSGNMELEAFADAITGRASQTIINNREEL